MRLDPSTLKRSPTAEIGRAVPQSTGDPERDLVEACETYRDDFEGWVRYFYPWGEVGGPLEKWSGPDWWHRELMGETSEYLAGDRGLPLRCAVTSGHGSGKTAFTAWLIQYFLSTRFNPQVVVTANTETQLQKTWRELAKWNQMLLNAHWFDWNATSYAFKSPKFSATWNAKAVTWSLNNTQAFAGTHEDNVLVIFDEASNIHDEIWTVTDGAMTTKGAWWFVFGNPTRNVGRFYECFHKHSKWWRTWQVDSRACQAANKEYLEQLIEQYGGEGTDEAKTRVLGQFPERATGQLISTEAVERAQKTEIAMWDYAPKVMGVDVARFGTNQSEIAIRQGRKVFPIIRVPKGDLMMQAQFVADQIKKERPNLVCVDGSGIGAGMVDRLRQLNFSVMDVNGGNSSMNPRFLNKRAEMYWEMKEFIELGECELPPDRELKDHLTVTDYGFTDKGRIRLRRKEDIFADHGFSPDKADALSLTFAYPVSDDVMEDVDPVLFEDS